MEYRIIATGLLEPNYLSRVILDWYRAAENPVSAYSQTPSNLFKPFAAQAPVRQNRTFHTSSFSPSLNFGKVALAGKLTEKKVRDNPRQIFGTGDLANTTFPISTQPAITQTATDFEIGPGIRLRKMSNLGNFQRDYFFWQEVHVLIMERFSGYYHWQKLKEGWDNPHVVNPAPVSLGRFSMDKPWSINVWQTTSNEKLAEAARRAIPLISRAGGGLLDQDAQVLLRPESIAALLAISTISLIRPVVGIELAIGSLYFVGSEVVDVLSAIKEYVALASQAQSESDLDQAANRLAEAAKVGGEVFFTLVVRRSGSKIIKKPIAEGKKERPPSPFRKTEPEPEKKPKAVAKKEKEEEPEEEKESSLDTLHTLLDVAGMIPVIGEAADGINALIYLAEGDYKNAAISGAAMIPIVGNAVTTAKLGNKAKKIWTSTKKLSGVENAFKHWKKHGKEFPNLNNAKEYVEATKDFLFKSPKGTLTKTRSNGDILKYHPESNTFAVMDSAGNPKTMFKPDEGLEYWLKQN